MNYYELMELNSDASKEENKKEILFFCQRNIIQIKTMEKMLNLKKLKKHMTYYMMMMKEKNMIFNYYLAILTLQKKIFIYQIAIIINFINSKEFKLMNLLYNSIPNNVKSDIWNKFKKTKQQYIVKAHKSIDIRELYHDETVNLFINSEDYKNAELKVLYLFTNNSVYYLYLRDNYNSFKIDNVNSILTLNFFIK